jgi:hypothetical protein
LQGISLQGQRLANEIRTHVQREIFRSFVHDLFTRRLSPKKRLIAQRQLDILEILLPLQDIDFEELAKLLMDKYQSVMNPRKAIVRDVNQLGSLRAISIEQIDNRFIISVRLEWPREITEATFFEHIKTLPKFKTSSFLSGSLGR